MSNFANLKKQSKLGSLTDKLVKEVEKMSTGGSGGADERFWKPEMDKTGVGSAIIRFLPAPDGEDLPWVKLYSHAFQGPGGWYIENSLTTLGQKDPISEHNRELWNTGTEANKEIVRKQKRKLSYYSNIYVVKDPAHPENEGKVFLFKFGKKIFDKILNAMQPEFEDEEPINPFDFWGGANFRLKIRKVEGYWNYDKSEFDSPSALLDDDDALEALWKKEHSLSAIVAPDQFKSYEDLEKRLKYVLGQKTAARAVAEQEEVYESYTQPVTKEESVMEELEESYRKSKSPTLPVVSSVPDDDDEDDAMKYFQKLVDD
jgi:gp32 DNA binding protein like